MSNSVHTQRYKEFLGRLRDARVSAGLTQKDVAARLAVPQSFVSKCESGERRVDVIELADFAEIYQCPLDYFVYGQKTEDR